MKGKSRRRRDEEKAVRKNGLAIACMVFASGFAGLIYQVLWMKQLGLLFGNTAQAASATLAAFFIGLGAGSWWWGRRVGASVQPLRLYARLEFGIALAALAYFVMLAVFDAAYPSIYRALAGGVGLLGIKFALALCLVFPAAFFMGGTVPAIGQVMIRERERFGRTAAMLYGVNTLGAALGVVSAAFIFIPSLGFRMTYGFAVLLSAGVGVAAWRLSRDEQPDAPIDKRADITGNPTEAVSWRERSALAALCFFSGFVVLALEVVWTRVFAQVHENSVYSFAIILTVVLICLAFGSGISSVLARVIKRPMLALGVMTMIGGGLLVLGPSLLMFVTSGLRPVNTHEPWAEYVRKLFMMGFGGIGYIVLALGTVFPFLMKVAERDLNVPGRMLGRLLAINTAGAIAGALLCGFVMLPMLGMWRTLQVLTAVYLIVGLLLPTGWGKPGIACRAAGLAFLALLFSALDPSGLPVIGMPSGREQDKVLQVWEGSDCTVAALERSNGHRSITVNAGYALGSTAAFAEQANQARIPLHLFPETKSICFIGLGTGMSAGASFNKRFPKVERVVTCELTPAVVEAAKKWIPPLMTGGVFSDPRSAVLIEDGRQFLKATDERFDMINADLFLPYQRGAGSLYSLDHYQVAAQRLNPDGVFVQWLPLYQLTEREFGVIARTMLEVFGEVTMWRNNFVPGNEKVALIGRLKPMPAVVPPGDDSEAMRRAVEGLEVWQTTPDMVRVEAEAMPFFYAGNLSAARSLFDGYPVNSDDRPVIEYETPWMFRKVATHDEVIWCVGPKLIAWIDRIFETCPIERDPLWAGHPASSAHMVLAGVAFHRAMVGQALGRRESTQADWDVFKREWSLGAQ